MRTHTHLSLATGVVLAGFALASAGASAQQAFPPAAPAATAKSAAPGTTAAGAAKAKTAKTGESAQSSSGGGEGGGMGKRLDQLEEQVVDMQVVIGTLESLAKSGAAASPAAAARASPGGGGLSSSDAARLDGIETQIRALTAQVESLAEQVRAQGQRRSEALPPPRAPAAAASTAATDFGSTSVSAASGGDPIGGLIAGSKTAAASQVGGGYSSATLPPVTGAAPAGDGGDQNPKQLYETAYGYLLQQDYGAAETAFDDFLRKYPSDSLSGNAQYWLGESFYVRGQYKQAASAFLKGYQTYGKSAKAPDSLLKLAMSLDKLGQKDAACSSYGELGTRFPTAPPHIKSRATSERQRLGCG